MTDPDLATGLVVPEPVDTVPLFAPLHRELLQLLRALRPDDWERPTLARAWRVRDVAAHLLDIDLRKLSVERDRHLPPADEPVDGYAALVRYLDRLNAEWVRAARRLSPAVLVDLLAAAGPAVAALVAQLPPHEEATFPVSWAGERRSPRWLDTGRDYTERWHHQMQIRDAVGAAPLLGAEWLRPVLEISARALPRAYAATQARVGAAVVLEVTGDAGGAWSLVRVGGDDAGWQLWRGIAPSPAARVRLDPDAAWRLYFNALPPDEARGRATVDGDPRLAEPMLGARAVMV